jgi:hypothetical protein
MKIILTTTLYLLFIVIVVPVAGQKKKSSTGYIITKTNDTVACEFEPFNWKKQPASIKVKINRADTVFNTSEIKGFMNPAGNEFTSRKIELFKYNRDIQTAVSGDVPSSEIISSAFLKVLYRGKINLYLYKDALGGDHYFIEKKSVIKEIYIHLYSSVGGYATSTINPHARKPVVVNNFKYYYGLKEMVQGCSTLFPEVDKTELNAKSLISLLKQYDRCIVVLGD